MQEVTTALPDAYVNALPIGKFHPSRDLVWNGLMPLRLTD